MPSGSDRRWKLRRSLSEGPRRVERAPSPLTQPGGQRGGVGREARRSRSDWAVRGRRHAVLVHAPLRSRPVGFAAGRARERHAAAPEPPSPTDSAALPDRLRRVGHPVESGARAPSRHAEVPPINCAEVSIADHSRSAMRSLFTAHLIFKEKSCSSQNIQFKESPRQSKP